MKKTGLKGYMYDFSVDYNTTPLRDIADSDSIHKYLIKKLDIK